MTEKNFSNYRGDAFASINTGVTWSPVLLASSKAPVDRIVKMLEFFNTNEGIATATMGPESVGFRQKTDFVIIRNLLGNIFKFSLKAMRD
ncbi:MAG TPA: hypothetical protein VIK78_20540 [Ruminiclostridium sp.]